MSERDVDNEIKWPDIDVTEGMFSKELTSDSVLEITKLSDLLKDRGLATKMGLELEFGLDLNANDLATLKARMLDLENQRTEDSNTGKIKNFIESAEAGELAVLLLYKTAWAKFLDPRFLESYDVSLIRDADGVTEIQTIPLDVTDSMAVKVGIIKELTTIARHLRMKPVPGGDPNYHLNLSFEDRDGNVFSEGHPDYLTMGKSLAEGITYSLARSLMFTSSLSLYTNTAASSELSLSASRTTGLRMANGRLEIKFGFTDGGQDVETVTALALSGALYSLDFGDLDNEIRHANIVDLPVVSRINPRLKVLNHLLNESPLVDEGELEISDAYVKGKVDVLKYELGLIKQLPKRTMFDDMMGGLMSSSDEPHIMQFLRRLKIDQTRGEYCISFPRDNPDVNVYSYTLPEIGMENIPEALRVKVRAGYILSEKERNKHLLPGQTIPRAAITKTIDVLSLENGLKCEGITKKFVIKEPVGRVDTNSRLEVARKRLNDFVSENNALMYLTSEFQNRLRKIASDYVESKTMYLD